VSGIFFGALGDARINVLSISQGCDERNISAVVYGRDATRALRAVHAAFWLSSLDISIGIVGAGRVGTAVLQTLIEQIHVLGACNCDRLDPLHPPHPSPLALPHPATLLHIHHCASTQSLPRPPPRRPLQRIRRPVRHQPEHPRVGQLHPHALGRQPHRRAAPRGRRGRPVLLAGRHRTHPAQVHI